MTHLNNSMFKLLSCILLILLFTACSDSEDPINTEVVLLLIDEESIDNDNQPNNFSAIEVNDQLAEIGLRTELQYFKEHPGEIIDLYTGQIGDEGWFALKNIPENWKSAGPTSNGSNNFLTSGPGLGTPNTNNDREAFLDAIGEVTPLRATGLAMLKGKTVIAVVYDNDIAINYAPLTGSLKGANLGMIAFDVVDVSQRNNGSSSSLPVVQIRIRDLNEVNSMPLVLFSNPPN